MPQLITTNAKGETKINIPTRNVNLNRIEALRDADIVKPTEFCLQLPWENLGVLEAVIAVLRDFARRDVVWGIFELVLSQISETKLGPFMRLLEVIHSLQLFEELKISVRGPRSGLYSERDSGQKSFLHGILENARLTKLRLELNINQCSSVDVEALCTILRTKSSLEELYLQFSGLKYHDEIFSSIAANASLKKVMLLFKEGATESKIASTVSLLAVHSSLRSLHLASHVFGSSASHAVQELLAHSAIEELYLFSVSKEPTLNSANVIEGIAHSTNLNSLKLGGLESFDSPEILPLVFQKPKFKFVELDLETIPNEIFDEMKAMDRRHNPLVLKLTRSIILQHTAKVKQLLVKHPEIRLMPLNVPIDKDFKKLCDSNWFGRYLMDRPDIPLGLWPIVLERPGMNHDIVHEMLKGPSLLGRGNLDV